MNTIGAGRLMEVRLPIIHRRPSGRLITLIIGYDVFINSLPTGLLTWASSTTSTVTYTDISSDIVTATLTEDVYNNVNFADYE
jgi:hypothetical protein